ncbi:hypothetical protein BGZ80_007340 [Entomortierella chlamydospora]|uniref:Uncharacterized protein n=1 Tax=Entomortierella chlamydospora TaxID=101097 RepID=A0A9P6MF12_9FUNG|nr:hypothetical protein BGZ80_007340 [Entomortierella chlamydospora]KAF9998239.1 hypothetical protein BGZ79_008091 [Entomortierella chlamydospora]
MSSTDENEPQEQQIESSTLVDTDVTLSSNPPTTLIDVIDVKVSTSDDLHNNDTNSFGVTESHTTENHATEQVQDDFGDFGSTGKDVPIANGIDGANDDFGDFGATATGGDDGFGDFGTAADDDDGFGDFGTAQTAGGDNGDDDFGDFNDFAGGDGFQDSGDFGEFGGSNDADAFGTPEPAAVEAPVAQVAETAPDFNAVNSRQVENYVLEKLAALYPVNDLSGDNSSSQLLNPDLEDSDAASLLSDQELWVSLCEQSFQGAKSASSAPQFQWKYSDLRKEYYASLGLVVAKEQSMGPSSIVNSASPTSSRSKVSSPMIVSTEAIPARKPLDMEAARAYCQFTKENLGGYSGDEMKDIIAQLTELTRQASEELTYWLDQREQMIMDSEKYNKMIGSLVDRAAQLKTAESRQGAKSKRLTRTSFNLK